MWTFPLFPERASTMAGEVDAVFFGGMTIVLGFLILIVTLIVTFLVRYRAGSKADRSGSLHTSFVLEGLWIGIPLLLSIAFFIPSAIVYFRQFEPPGDAYEVSVVGKQWMFYLQHPEGKREISELHIPVGRPVRLTMTSQDVIHSFYVPAFRAKQDLLPGRYTTMWFTPTVPGTYPLYCAEYCGTNHSVMGGEIHVMDPADYERWLGFGPANTSMAKQGEALFQSHHCGGCHGGSQAVRAPALAGVYGSQVPITEGDEKVPHVITADDRYIRDSILLPKSQVVAGYEPLMPSYQGQLSEEDLLRLIAYIKSIGPKKEATR